MKFILPKSLEHFKLKPNNLFIVTKNHYPLPLVAAMLYDDYDDPTEELKDASVVISPSMFKKTVKAVVIEKIYKERLKKGQMEAEENIEDSFAMFLGTAVHYYLENISKKLFKDDDRHIFEERKTIDVSEITGIRNSKLSGKVDMIAPYQGIPEKMVIDYKITSSWAFIFDPNGDDHKTQLELLAFLFKEDGVSQDYGMALRLFKDYSDTQASRSADYPKSPIDPCLVELRPDSDELKEKMKYYAKWIHFGNENKDTIHQEDLPECTEEELEFRTDGGYKVYKEKEIGNQRGNKFGTLHEAKEHMSTKGGHLYYKNPTAGKCTYCPIQKYCKQGHELAKKSGTQDYLGS